MAAFGIDHEYVSIPDVGHDAPAILAALLAHGDFYRRALAGGVAAASAPAEVGPAPATPRSR